MNKIKLQVRRAYKYFLSKRRPFVSHYGSGVVIKRSLKDMVDRGEYTASIIRKYKT